MTGAAAEHEWATKKLAPFAAGLLDTAEQERFLAHAAGCAECQRRLDRLRASHHELGHHIPERLLRDWATATRDLRGLERELVIQHLKSCDECQAVLEYLGHEPYLEPQEEAFSWAVGDDALDSGADQPTVTPPTSQAGTRRPAPWTRREFWAGAGLGGALAVAAALVLVAGPITLFIKNKNAGPLDSRTLGRIGSVPVATPLRYERSGDSETVRVHIEPGSRIVSFFVQPSALQPGQPVELHLYSGGALLAADTLLAPDFGEDRRLVWLAPAPIRAGRYMLVLASRSASDTARFEVSTQ